MFKSYVLVYLCLKLILVYVEKPFVIMSNNINHTTYETLPFMPYKTKKHPAKWPGAYE